MVFVLITTGEKKNNKLNLRVGPDDVAALFLAAHSPKHKSLLKLEVQEVRILHKA